MDNASVLWVPIIVIFALVYLLLPFKLWRMADWVKSISKNVEENQLLEALVVSLNR